MVGELDKDPNPVKLYKQDKKVRFIICAVNCYRNHLFVRFGGARGGHLLPKNREQ